MIIGFDNDCWLILNLFVSVIKKQIIKESISIYNEQRPHYSNHMLTPNQMHCQNQMQIRTYKNKNSCKNVLATV